MRCAQARIQGGGAMGAIASPLTDFFPKKNNKKYVNELKLKRGLLKIKWVKSDDFLKKGMIFRAPLRGGRMEPPTGGMMEGLLVSKSPFLGDFLAPPLAPPLCLFLYQHGRRGLSSTRKPSRVSMQPGTVQGGACQRKPPLMTKTASLRSAWRPASHCNRSHVTAACRRAHCNRARGARSEGMLPFPLSVGQSMQSASLQRAGAGAAAAGRCRRSGSGGGTSTPAPPVPPLLA